jgi:hypothetical protein
MLVGMHIPPRARESQEGLKARWKLTAALWWFVGLLTGISGYCVVRWFMEGKPRR